MTASDIRCGVVIYAAREGRIRTCGSKATHSLLFGGDYLFGVCPRHNDRLERAIPDLRSSAYEPGDRCGDNDRLRLPA